MSTFRFRAVITLNEAAHDRRAAGYPSGTHAVMVHAARIGQPGHERYFEAVIEQEDQKPLNPGDHAVVTITLADPEAREFFAPGRHFILWDGGDVGTGVVSRQVFTSGSPS